MIERPDRYVTEIARAGADSITIHIEATPHVHYTLQAIRESGCAAGAAICPPHRRPVWTRSPTSCSTSLCA